MNAVVVQFDRAGRVAPRKRKYTRLTPTARARLDAEILLMDSAGQPGTADWQRLADRYDIAIRTVYYAVDRVRGKTDRKAPICPVTGARITWGLPDDVLEVIAGCGSVSAAYDELVGAERYVGSLSAFRRRIDTQFGSNVVKRILRGVQGTGSVPRPKQPAVPFMSRYTIDLYSLRLPLLDVDEPTLPVGMNVIESSTGTIVFEWVFPCERVASADILAVLAEAFRGHLVRDESLFVGGVPDTVHCDNATIHVGREVREALKRFGAVLLSDNSYSSWELGKHERPHRTFRGRVLNQLPGSSDGPRDRAGNLLPDPRRLRTLQEVRDLSARFADWHNTTMHKDGRIPFDSWEEAAAANPPKRETSGALARLASEHPVTCKRNAAGISFGSENYVAPWLMNRSERSFTIRTWLRDARTIEVFTNSGTYVGSATLAPTAAEMQAIKAKEVSDRTAALDAIGAHRTKGAAEDALRDAQAARNANEQTNAAMSNCTDAHLGVEPISEARVLPGTDVSDSGVSQVDPLSPEGLLAALGTTSSGEGTTP